MPLPYNSLGATEPAPRGAFPSMIPWAVLIVEERGEA